jgi:hypothetical protein
VTLEEKLREKIKEWKRVDYQCYDDDCCRREFYSGKEEAFLDAAEDLEHILNTTTKE